MTDRPKIISLGEVLWDLFPEGERFGGAPANFASHAAMLGADVIMVSAVGSDEKGREAESILGSYGIDTHLLQVKDTFPTGTVSVDLDENGVPAYIIHEAAAWDHVEWRPEIGRKVASADAIYFGTLGQRNAVSRAAIQRVVEMAAEGEVRRILDVNLRPPFYDDRLIRDSIKAASVLKLSDEELSTVLSACRLDIDGSPEESLRAILDRFSLDVVVMTRGADGALLVAPEETVDQPGIPTTVVDTVGAGDSFTAALVHGLYLEEPHGETLVKACQLAAEVCAQSGAVPTNLMA